LASPVSDPGAGFCPPPALSVSPKPAPHGPKPQESHVVRSPAAVFPPASARKHPHRRHCPPGKSLARSFPMCPKRREDTIHGTLEVRVRARRQFCWKVCWTPHPLEIGPGRVAIFGQNRAPRGGEALGRNFRPLAGGKSKVLPEEMDPPVRLHEPQGNARPPAKRRYSLKLRGVPSGQAAWVADSLMIPEWSKNSCQGPLVVIL